MLIEKLKELLANRIAQWIARALIGLVIYLCGRYGWKFDDQMQQQLFSDVCTMLAIGVYILFERYSHQTQQQDVVGKALELAKDRTLEGTAPGKPISPLTLAQAVESVKQEDTRIIAKLPKTESI